MKRPIKQPALLTLAVFVLCLYLARQTHGERASGLMRDALSSQEAAGDANASVPTYQHLSLTQSAYLCEYGFRDFNQDNWNVHFSLNRAGLKSYEESFGYTQSGLNRLQSWRQAAVASGLPAKEANAEYYRKSAAYFNQHGFKIAGPGTLVVDMPALVKKNTAPLSGVAAVFARIGSQKGYDSGDIIGAAAAMVQTAVRYEEVPDVYNGRNIGGVLPPLQVLAEGWGDCDTKSGLLAAILSNWSGARMVGVRAPAHYFIGVLRIPQSGDYYVQYGGLNYVLIETAGPAWLPPGTVSEYTASILRADDYQIEPFF